MVGILDGLRDQTALVSTAVWARNASWEQEAAEHRAILEAMPGERAARMWRGLPCWRSTSGPSSTGTSARRTDPH